MAIQISLKQLVECICIIRRQQAYLQQESKPGGGPTMENARRCLVEVVA